MAGTLRMPSAGSRETSWHRRGPVAASGACLLRGFTLLEVAVASAMLAVLLAVTARVLVAARQQTRATEQHAAALAIVENSLEELTSGQWDEIDEQAVASLELPEEVRRRWPQAELSGEVQTAAAPVQQRRVSLRLVLSPEARRRPARLTTWVFRAAED